MTALIIANTQPACDTAGCTNIASVRVGFPSNGHPPTEADLCSICGQEHWDRGKGGVSSLGIPSPVYGPVGVPIWPHAENVVKRSAAANRDDAAAMRGI